MTKIYNQFDSAFIHVSAYAIMQGNKHIANINIKYPKDGAGRVWCYIHLFCHEMQRAYASGYGYDKRDTAIKAAMQAVKAHVSKAERVTDTDKAFVAAMDSCGSGGTGDWKQGFERSGFLVVRAI